MLKRYDKLNAISVPTLDPKAEIAIQDITGTTGKFEYGLYSRR